jgi:hypothetical protein
MGMEKKMSKSLLSLRLTVDHNSRNEPVYVFIKLYKEAEGLIWRLFGEYGDELGLGSFRVLADSFWALPRPASVAQAKADARAVYGRDHPFKPSASWL